VNPASPSVCGACGGGGEGAPLDNVRSPQNANVPPISDINLNPPAAAAAAPGRGVPPPIPARAPPPPRPSDDDLGNHLMPHVAHDQRETTAFTHNLFPTLDFIDEFAD